MKVTRSLSRSAKLAGTAANRMAGDLATDAFAGPYLADQRLLPLGVSGGGSFTTVKPSQHARTAADVIRRFLDQRCAFTQQVNGTHRRQQVLGGILRAAKSDAVVDIRGTYDATRRDDDDAGHGGRRSPELAR